MIVITREINKAQHRALKRLYRDMFKDNDSYNIINKVQMLFANIVGNDKVYYSAHYRILKINKKLCVKVDTY